MGFADDMRDLLSTGGITESIFCGDLPELPATALCITQTAGGRSEHAFGGTVGIPILEIRRCQIRVRAADYLTAETLMTSVHGKLDGMRDRGINGRLYQWVRGTTTPYYIGLDEAEQPLFGCNYDACVTRTT